MTTTLLAVPVDTDLAARAAGAAAAVLPAVEPLNAGAARPGDGGATNGLAAAAVAELTGAVSGRVAVLIGQDLVTALASSPMGGLDAAAAAQPAIDAIAGALGANAAAARQVDLALVLADLGACTAVPLITSIGITGAMVLISDSLLVASPEPEAIAVPPVAAAPAPSPQLGTSPHPVGATPVAAAPLLTRGIEMLAGVDMEVTVELGRARMTVRELLALAPGAVLELDRAAGSPADLLVNGRLIARGEVVVIDEDFGLRVTEIVDSAEALTNG